MARLAAVLAALAALAWAPGALAHDGRGGDDGNRLERGVVQSVGVRSLTMRTLDGATMVVRVDARTRVLVANRRASLRDIRRGFVVLVAYDDGRSYAAGDPAREVQAFGGAAPGGSGGPGRPPKSRSSQKNHGGDG